MVRFAQFLPSPHLVPQLAPPPEVVGIARTLEAAGFETWCVGGAVRDALLGLPNEDWDLATAAPPPEVRRLFRRTVPVGVEFGTVGVLDNHGVMHEVTTFRSDVDTDGRHAVVRFGASLDEDLARRDFTINAIAYSPSRNEIRDPFGGQADLAAGVVRAVGIAHDRMREDRLRALRGIRFASRFSFDIEADTWQAILDSVPALAQLSAERVKQELEKTMEQVASPSDSIGRWTSSGAMRTLAPLVDAALAGDTGQDMMAALDCVLPPRGLRRERSDARVRLRLALLVLALPRAEAALALRSLRFSNADVAWAAELADRWARVRPLIERSLAGQDIPSDAEVRRWVAQMGRSRTPSVLRAAAAVWAGRRCRGLSAPSSGAVQSLYRRAIRTAYRDPVEVADLALDGADLQRAGVQPGPAVGRMLVYLLERVLDDPSLNRVDALLAAVQDASSAYTPDARSQ